MPEPVASAPSAPRHAAPAAEPTPAAAPAPSAEPAQPAEPEADGYVPVIGRIPILSLTPQIEDDLWPAKSFVHDVVPFGATIFREGHDLIGADVLVTDPTGAVTAHRMSLDATKPGLDRWITTAQLETQGVWTWRVSAWSDDFGTWLHNAEIKVPAGLDVDVMLALGAEALERASADETRDAADRGVLRAALAGISDADAGPDARLAAATTPEVLAAIDRIPLRSLVTLSPERTIVVERERAAVGSWYEFFPRSEGAVEHEDGSWTSGTFRTAARRLPAIRDMGFDVVYIPPVHPIGRTNRKGPNNTLTAGPHDPGSPYGIGSEDGGHDSIHPELGTAEDFRAFVQAVADHGMELAIDIALQASPDHPWVTTHPELFTTLPDGSIAFAENPPKKYQDIYPLNFDNDPQGSYREMLRVMRVWLGLGVKIFRVDNPHTKPLVFWERLIHQVMRDEPDAIFLSEAFTRPAMMRTLAKIGFQQSYTYFTWRNTKEELEEYLTEVSHETSDYLRPNFFANTHDILTPYLQFGGRAAYRIRAAIAATASPSWGIYSGYELIENVARPGAEENIDNEKYEYKPRDWARQEELGGSIAPEITRLNEIRRQHPALRQLRNLDVHWSDDDSILVYSKHLAAEHTGTGQADTILVVANVDPHSARETQVHLDPTRWGLAEDAVFDVEDLLTGDVYTWSTSNFVRLDAFTHPVHVFRVTPTASKG
ncbi:alpha-1,4-glucan--maltose-1-phosphate maltosyltransferase [Clavibacter michiganensis]|uniref:alpha-1,4-glucan--maltose-1-phosphate maltosyltransferase n=2 Tax=Clavibacter michiganensis TaxID=28447 RepID=UPI001D0B336F|nr:alpha-1,4-glucan--maltose-1-phosphate maltosyltransferase [Clavibacter michiganensis]MDO4043820.1 alpha-1,4-glucan--maltose-1-phosphate maltosyltransferase [Clavibacter michiganensis]MDO4053061.1 alpha-1,4-glucan--maltose-1-phosphate maltosyltransferase [Clavibacter michiganensis]MDO4056082.1 alpha-1,4-glucan--maltose-1-phosphate maltosyltransferase [Clavibacter michiganensis]MDO4064614.1 alpha-1,4-glucan--maltose-1-phosphate maltosyltransferase [Clavibacter michiganensis]MDO4067683.1 alpha